MVLLAGVIGAAVLLLFFVLDQFGKIKNDTLWYDGGNFVGATLLAFYAYMIGSVPFTVIEVAWALVSLRDVLKDLRK